MRTTVAALGAISFLFVGVTAISESAQQAEPTIDSEAGNASYQLGVDVFGGVSQAGIGIVWFGVAAIVVVSLGLLVVAGNGGR